MMDEQYIRDHNVIERYLTGRLDREELDAFTLLLMRDKALQQKVEANRMLFKTLWKANQEATVKPQKKRGLPRWWIIGFGVLLLSALIWFLIPSNDQESSRAEQDAFPVEVPLEEEPTEPAEIPVPVDEPDTEAKDEIIQPEPRKNTQNEVQDPGPIASADLTPNPLLENYMESVRGASISISEPEQSAQYVLSQGAFSFQIKGEVTLDNMEEEALQLYFFTNKKEDYEQFLPLETIFLTLNLKEDNSYTFQWQQTLNWEPGLYYYIIEGENTGLLYAGKFTVSN